MELRSAGEATHRPNPEEEHPGSAGEDFFEGDELLTEEQKAALDAAVIEDVSSARAPKSAVTRAVSQLVT